MKCSQFLFIAFSIWLFWFSRLLYGLSPYFWVHGDVMRSLREWKFWFGWTFYSHSYKNDHTALKQFYIYPENFPDFTKDDPIQVYVVTNENVTAEIIEKTWLRGEGVLHWINAAKDKHLEMQGLQYIRDNFDMEKYYLGSGDLESYMYYNDSNWDTAYEYPMWGADPIKMQDFVDNTLDGEHLPYYLGFNFKVSKENPKVRQALLTILDEAVESVAGPKYYSSRVDTFWWKAEAVHSVLEFFFMYYGTENYATIHNAVMDDTFIQIANTKRWVFWHPRYYPYMHMTCKSFGSAAFIDFEEIPKVAVDIAPGDLLYFPPSYIHTVLNLEEKPGFGLGIRDIGKSITDMFTNVFLGSNVQANVGAFWVQFFNMVRAKVTGFDLKAESAKRSGISAFQPIQKYDEFQIQQWHKHIADCHNKFEYLKNPASGQKRGVEYGNGRGHADSPFGPNMAKVMNAEMLQRVYEEKEKFNQHADQQELARMLEEEGKDINHFSQTHEAAQKEL